MPYSSIFSRKKTEISFPSTVNETRSRPFVYALMLIVPIDSGQEHFSVAQYPLPASFFLDEKRIDGTPSAHSIPSKLTFKCKMSLIFPNRKFALVFRRDRRVLILGESFEKRFLFKVTKIWLPRKKSPCPALAPSCASQSLIPFATALTLR